jgi:hypothetical protein
MGGMEKVRPGTGREAGLGYAGNDEPRFDTGLKHIALAKRSYRLFLLL